MVGINNNIGMMNLASVRNCQPLTDRNNIAFAGKKAEEKNDEIELSCENDSYKEAAKASHDKMKKASELVQNIKENKVNKYLPKFMHSLVNVGAAVVIGMCAFACVKVISFQAFAQRKDAAVGKLAEGLEFIAKHAKNAVKELQIKFPEDTKVGKLINGLTEKTNKGYHSLVEMGKRQKIKFEANKKIRNSVEPVTKQLKAETLKQTIKEQAQAFKSMNEHKLAAEAIISPTVTTASGVFGAAAGISAAVDSADGDTANALNKFDKHLADNYHVSIDDF